MHPGLEHLRDLYDRHRAAALGIAYGAGGLVLFLLIAGGLGSASRSSAEVSEAAIERRVEEARARPAAPPPARIEPRRRPPPRPRRAAPATRVREYEVRVREPDPGAVPEEALPPPPADALSEEARAEPLPEVPPGEGDELHDPEG